MKLKNVCFGLMSLLCCNVVLAGTQGNTMTNTVVLHDACDIVAIGVDFGLMSVPVQAAGAVTANTAAGNLVSGQSGSAHPDQAKDGGAANQDDLSLTLGVPDPTNLLGTAIGAVDVTTPGVYVLCTLEPSKVTLTSAAGASIDLKAGDTVFAGTMTKTDDVGITIDYSLTFVANPILAATSALGGLPGVGNPFVTAYTMTAGNIPLQSVSSSDSSKPLTSGFYVDRATAVVEY